MFRYTEKKLAKDIGRIAKYIDPSLVIEYKPEAREVTLSVEERGRDKAPTSIFLGNIFMKMKELGRKERAPSIERLLNELLSPRVFDPDDFMNSLAIRVRTDFEISLRKKMMASKGYEQTDLSLFRIGEALLELISDNEESISTVKNEDIEKAGITKEEGLRIAGAALVRATGLDQWEQVEPHIWMSTYQDDYDFARIVAADDNVRIPFDGNPIFFAPSHSICLVTDQGTDETLLRMIAIGEKFSENHRPFSQSFWQKSNDGLWKQWLPLEGEPGRQAASLQRVKEAFTQYDEQKEHLQAQVGEEVFVSKFQATNSEAGIMTFSVYTLNIPTYLPLTDEVSLYDHENEEILGNVGWSVFNACLGPDYISAVEDEIPARYKVMDPLLPEQVEYLRERAVKV